MDAHPPQIDYAELDRLIDRVLEGTLSDAQASRLAALLTNSPAAVQRYAEALDTHTALCEIYPGGYFGMAADDEQDTQPACEVSQGASLGTSPGTSFSSRNVRPWSSPFEWAIVLTAVFCVGLIGYLMGQGDSRSPSCAMATGSARPADPKVGSRHEPVMAQTESQSQGYPLATTLAGHGTLREAVDVVWPASQAPYREGGLLGPGSFKFESGIAVLDLFSGATLVVKGPAHLDIESDWAVTVHEGKLEATVPPAAQGFVIKAADTEIIDLGTQFALDMSSDKAQVAVLDGEVMLRGDRFADDHLLTGEQATLSTLPVERNFVTSIPRLADIASRRETISQKRFHQYRQFIDKLAADPQLIAFYPPRRDILNRLLPNVAGAAHAGNAQLIGPVEIAPGRFSGESVGLGFRRPGSRARMKLDGTFSAYSFSCWAKIDSLAHRYNALFLADGYENGEPHWQIRSDGRLMFSVMVDEDRELVYPGGPKTPPIHDAGFHHVYFSQPVWNKSLAGAWLHLVAVYDPASRKVIQYVNGNEVARETIADEFLISDLHIGAAEIGNWGQPFRATPDFAVRNLDGVIDEMLITSKPLSPKEIVDLYQQGKPK